MATITYSTAIQTLQSMFPDIEESVVRMFLDSNRGHMERTIEQLLTMQQDFSPPSQSTSSESESGQSTETDQTAGQSTDSSTSPDQGQAGLEEKSPSPSSDLRVFDVLPKDFLRPPAYFQNPNRNQIAQDQLLAQMMQDSLFMQQLRSDPDFFMDGRAGEDDSSNWKEKMSVLGTSAKAKLASIAAKFKKNDGVEGTRPRGALEERRLLAGSPFSDDEDSALLSRDPDASFSIGDDSDPDSPDLRDARFSRRPLSSAGKSVELQTIRSG